MSDFGESKWLRLTALSATLNGGLATSLIIVDVAIVVDNRSAAVVAVVVVTEETGAGVR